MAVNGGSESTDIKLLDAALQKKTVKSVVYAELTEENTEYEVTSEINK